MDIVKQINKVIDKYERLRTKDSESIRSNNSKVNKLFVELEESFRASINFYNIQVDISRGQGNLPKRPVVYFKDSRLSKSGTNGIYVALVIEPKTKKHEGSFDLVLTQGEDTKIKEVGNDARIALSNTAKVIAVKYKSEILLRGFDLLTSEDGVDSTRIFQLRFPTKAKITSKKLIDKLNDALAIYVDLAEASEIKALAGNSPDLKTATEYQPNRVTRSILERRGQSDFRRKLLKLYGGECLVTGCKVEAALEAAHITPVKDAGNMSSENGLLLRSDIHTLYDLQLFAISATGEIQWCQSLQDSEYGTSYKTVTFPDKSEIRDVHLTERLALFNNEI